MTFELTKECRLDNIDIGKLRYAHAAMLTNEKVLPAKVNWDDLISSKLRVRRPVLGTGDFTILCTLIRF